MAEQLPNPFDTLSTLETSRGVASYYSIPALKKAGFKDVGRVPVCLRLILESLLRHCHSNGISKKDVERLARYNASSPSKSEIPFVVARIILQDFTGVPLLVDLAAMRDAVVAFGKDPLSIEPQVPVDLVVDHSVQVDYSGNAGAFSRNLDKEFERNAERYAFLKWGQQAFKTFSVVPPGTGIVHQVNLEHLARLLFVQERDGNLLLYPDTLVGTDSHTTMINGLGIVGWGVGGIEAEAGMLGQPISFQTPEVVGVHMTGVLPEGTTATDLALHITELLRKHEVVGKFVEFFGEGASSLPVADRATLANMAPEYGATMGFFPIDERSLDYLRLTNRSEDHIELIRSYFQTQELFGMPEKGDIDYSFELHLDLNAITSSVAGPKRPQDRICLNELKQRFCDLLELPLDKGGYALDGEACHEKATIKTIAKKEGGDAPIQYSITHGDILIAAITSCTNTSNPSVMMGAGLLAKKAVALGLSVPSYVKCSLAPGSKVVTDYLQTAGLQEHLDTLGFYLVGYGCTTCIGNSGPLHPDIEKAIKEKGIVAASVLSGNRNFEARVHSAIGANFLMSPPLVVAYALAGTVQKDLRVEPLGIGKNGDPVYLRDIWPSQKEIQDCVTKEVKGQLFRSHYDNQETVEQWDHIIEPEGSVYQWDEDSTYIQPPPFFQHFQKEIPVAKPVKHAHALAILGDSVTTDHISPAGAIAPNSSAGSYLREQGVPFIALNSYGSRRGNDKVMTRGTFANVRLRNALAQGKQGGYTTLETGELVSIYEAAEIYRSKQLPLVVFAGKDYGMGSSRDWAAKGTYLLGVRVVVAVSFERIHRSNLIGMGVLPLCFKDGVTPTSLKLDGSETFSFLESGEALTPLGETPMHIHRKDGSTQEILLRVRIDTDVEKAYYRHGGILPFVLRRHLFPE